MTIIHGLQAACFVAAVGLVVDRIRALCVRGPIDVEPLIRTLRSLSSERAEQLLARVGDTFVARAIAPFFVAAPADRDVALEEGLAEAKEGILQRLHTIRIAATASSFLGFVGAANELQWIYSGEHGLLGLDPSRVQAVGLGNAALSIALGVGGSSFALGSWVSLRQVARRLTEDCDRAVERVRNLVPR